MTQYNASPNGTPTAWSAFFDFIPYQMRAVREVGLGPASRIALGISLGTMGMALAALIFGAISIARGVSGINFNTNDASMLRDVVNWGTASAYLVAVPVVNIVVATVAFIKSLKVVTMTSAGKQ